MNKEDILLKNYSILIKNPLKNADAIKSVITQLSSENPIKIYLEFEIKYGIIIYNYQ